ncbi:MAG: GNAT family N-acetyltransferase, partial [Chitinophagaceae bacterium]|nr:GNAT family N-acetyltransferase [Chitinophagaceae bacterium]
LCHDVYLQAGYIGKPLPDRVIPYEYDADAVYIVATNNAGEVVGTIRLTIGSHFKTLDVWKNDLYSTRKKFIHKAVNGRSFEIGALAVDKDYRTMKVSWELYRAAYLYAISHNLNYALISMDARALRSLEMLGLAGY